MPPPGPAVLRVDGYDRTAASRTLARQAYPGLFPGRFGSGGGAVAAEFLGGEPGDIAYRLDPADPGGPAAT